MHQSCVSFNQHCMTMMFSGFVYPCLIGVGINILIITWVLIMVPETRDTDTECKTDTKQKTPRGILQLCSQTDKIEQIQLILFLIAYCLDKLHSIQLNLLNTTLIAWINLGPTHLGYYHGINNFGNALLVLIIVTIGKKYIKEHVNMVVASISGILEPIMMAFATTEWMFYLGQYSLLQARWVLVAR